MKMKKIKKYLFSFSQFQFEEYKNTLRISGYR